MRARPIAFYLPSLRGGGAERVVINLAQGIVERGLSVDIVLAAAEGTFLDHLPPSVRVVDLRAGRVLLSLGPLVGYLRRERPRALVSSLTHANVIAVLAARLARVATPVIATVHNTMSESAPQQAAWLRRLWPALARTLYPWASCVVAVSRGAADDLARTAGLPRDKIEVIYNPVITPPVMALARQAADHSWLTSGDPPVILGVGRLTRQKDFPTLIRAFAQVRRKRPARLIILGEGEDRPRLEALAAELGIASDVALPGFKTNAVTYMAASALFVLSSAWEGLPTVLIEALAVGTPVSIHRLPERPPGNPPRRTARRAGTGGRCRSTRRGHARCSRPAGRPGSRGRARAVYQGRRGRSLPAFDRGVWMSSIAYAMLWIFIFSLPWEVVGAVNRVAVVARLTGAMALVLVLVTVAITGQFRRLHLFHIAMLLFLMWAGLDLFLFSNAPVLPVKFWTFVQLGLVVWMIWEVARSWPRLLGLLVAYVLGAYVAAFNTLLLYRREAGALRRFTAGGTDPNDLAMTLALALPMAWYLGMRHRHALIRWICRVYLPVGVLAIGLTGSRGGLLTTIVALLIVPLMMDRLTPGRLVTAVVMLAGAFGLAAVYVPDTIVERLGSTSQEVTDARFGGRFRLWKAGFHAFERRPLVGYGTSGFIRAVSPELGSLSKVAHNTYLSVLVEQGILGLSFYLMMFVAVCRAILTLPKPERRFALTLLATLAIAIFPLTWEQRKPLWFILAALLGLSQAWLSAAGEVVRPLDSARIRPALRPRAAARRLEPLPTPGADQDAIA